MIRSSLFARSALGLALSLGVAAGGLAVSAPAMAAKEKKAAPANYSAAFRAVAVNTQKAIAAAKAGGDLAAARAAVDATFAAVANEDDRFLAANFALELGSFAKDPALQRRGIEAALQSGKLAQDQQAKFNFALGQMKYQEKKFADAYQQFVKARDLGFVDTDGNLSALMYDSAARSGDPQVALALANADIAKAKASGGTPPAIALRSVIVSAYGSKQLPLAFEYAPQLVSSYPSKDNWNLATVVVRELAKYPAQDNIDLMRLMMRTGALKDGRDYLEYLQNVTGRVGVLYPGEVIKVANEAVARGLLKPTDVTEYLTAAKAAMVSDKASLPKLERDARLSSASALSVMATADTFLSYDQPVKAEELYRLALTKPGVDKDRALTRLGIALLDQGKNAEAKTTFGQIAGARKQMATLWSIYAAQKAAAPVAAAPAS